MEGKETKQLKTGDLTQLFEEFIKQRRHAEGYSPVTIKNYRNNFELLKLFKPDLNLTDLTTQTMIDFFTFLNARERKVGTRNNVVRDLKNSSVATIRGKLNSFFNWLLDNNYVAVNPFNNIVYPDFGYTDKRAFTREEFDKIYLAITRDIVWESQLLKKRNTAFVMVFVLTGIRKGECLGLKLTDIDLKQRLLTIRGETSKSRRDKRIPVNPGLIPYLEDYLNERGDYTADALWVSGNQDRPFTEHGLKHFVNRIRRATGINKFHVHRFRHTFATNFYIQSEHDIMSLQRLMGHRNPKTTMSSYLRSFPNEEVFRQMQRFRVAKFE
ncbi:MAG: hypothetical protein C3F02_01180 [Parcubacteria group bacterium]|nr:MAG: hypothetical protein C3F02_01180 [Parcubacteria group bacterium]